MANIPLVMVTPSLNIPRGQDFVFKFSPRDGDTGAVHDCSAITGATFQLFTDLTGNAQTTNATCTASGDATGVTITVTKANLTTALDAKIGGRGGNYVLSITDGTDTGYAANGSFQQPYNGLA